MEETIEHVMLQCTRYEKERTEMVNVVKQEIGINRWNEMIEGRPKRTKEYLLGLSIIDKWTNESTESVKVFLGPWAARVW